MHGPEGERHDEDGCFPEVMPQERIAFSGALGEGFRPVVAGKHGGNLPMTAMIMLTDDRNGDDGSLAGRSTPLRAGSDAAIAQLEKVARRLAGQRT